MASGCSSGSPTRPRDLALALAIAGAVVGLRLLVMVPDFGGVSPDHGNVWLAVDQVDVSLERPHPPGALLHVLAVRSLTPLCGSRAQAMLALSILASALGCGLLHAWLRRWYTTLTSLLITAAVATNPMAWFYGATTEAYSLDLLFGVLVVWLASCRRGVLWLPVVMAIAGGVRPFSPFLLLPVYVLAWWQALGSGAVGWRALVMAHLAGVAAGLAWLVPLVGSAGGPAAYVALCLGYAGHYVDPLRNLLGLSLFMLPVVLPTAVLVLAWFRQGSRDRALADVPLALVVAWLAVPLVVFATVLYEKAYFLLVLAPWLLLWLRPIRSERRRQLALAVAVVLQAAFFLGMPHRWPDVEVTLAPRHRSLSPAEVWWQRNLSSHLQAASRLRALADVADEVADLLQDAPPRTVIYADQSVPLSLRALQVRFPDRAFARSEVFAADTYRLHHGPREVVGTGLADLLERSVILTRRDLADAWLQPLVRGEHAAGLLMLARPMPGAAPDLAARYDDLFTRP
jgi:hypothetical protein